MALEEAIRDVLRNEQLPCAVAFKVAKEQDVLPGEVGDLATELDIRVSHCQLGLFGYGPKEKGLHKILKPAEAVSDELQLALQARVNDDGKLTCADVWAVAEALDIAKMEAAAAMEAVGLRLVHCQLHCF